MIILKVTKNTGFTLFLKDTYFEKSQGDLINPHSRLSVNKSFKNKAKERFTRMHNNGCHLLTDVKKEEFSD